MADTRLLERRNGISFLECLETCIHEREFVAQYQRLSGKKLVPTNPIDRMIDEATGYNMVVIGEFVDFVYEFVFQTLPIA